MLRSFSLSAALAILATTGLAQTAMADDRTVNVDVRVDVASLTDATAAADALRTVERQAKKACSYVQPVTHLKRTDWSCVKNIIDQTVQHVDAPMLTAAHSTSERMIQIAQRAEANTLLQ